MKRTILKNVIIVAVVLAQLVGSIAYADGTSYPIAGEVDGDQLPYVSARSYVLMDQETGEVLFSANEKQRMPIASTTKILTCMVALEHSKLEDSVTVTAESCGIEGSSVYLYDGEVLTVKDLLYAIMLESANDAAVCIARHVAGSVEAFSELMNKKVSDLGLKDSHFNNPHGLEDPQHYSTAYDMAVLWREAMKDDTFRRIVSTKNYRMDLDNDEGYRFLSNHNKLLKTYENCIGGKTGYTKTAGRCLVTSAEFNGTELIMVTLNDPDDWQDHENMYRYVSSMYSCVELATPGSVKYTLPIVGAEKNSVELSNRDALSISLTDVSKLTSYVEAPHFVYAPITSKEIPLARVIYTVDGRTVATLDLYPTETVNTVKKKFSLINFFKSIFD